MDLLVDVLHVWLSDVEEIAVVDRLRREHDSMVREELAHGPAFR